MHKSEYSLSLAPPQEGQKGTLGRVPAWRFDLRPQDQATVTMAVNLALRGKQLSRTEFHDPAKPYCDSPVLIGRRVSSRNGAVTQSLEISQFGPCRKCPKCLQFKQMRWRERCLYEIAIAPRTWFVTLTISPVHMAGIYAEAHQLTKPHAFGQRLERAAYKHVAAYLDRVRKAAKCKIRYLSIYERGSEGGRSHYHLLLHEVDGPVVKSILESRWRSNVHARLVGTDDAGKRASYLTKYITKSLDIRPRASVGYGKTPEQVQGEKDSRRRKTAGT